MRKGFTLVELLVSIAIIGLLLAITVPAVGFAREAARRLQCQNHLKQLMLGVTNYESDYGMYPSGFQLKLKLLPYLSHQNLYEDFRKIDNASSDTERTTILEQLRSRRIAEYLCPSDSAPERIGDGYASNYVGCYGTGLTRKGYDGFFRPEEFQSRSALESSGSVRTADVTNGLSNTVAFSEWLHSDGSYARLRVRWQTPHAFAGPAEYEAFANYCEAIPPNPFEVGWRGSPFERGTPWTLGGIGFSLYNHVLPPNRPSCNNLTFVAAGIQTAGSQHVSGVNVGFGDGHVSFIGVAVDRITWRNMGSRLGPDSAP